MYKIVGRCVKKSFKINPRFFNNLQFKVTVHRLCCEHFYYFKRNCSSGIITPTTRYFQRIKEGTVSQDNHQEIVVHALEHVHKNILHYSRPSVESKSKFSFFNFGKKTATVSAPKGLYIHGSVGGGKTMLMDLFYDTVLTEQKRRVHFNAFMLDVHARIHDLKSSDRNRTSFKGNAKYFDPIPIVATDITEETWLICFDEFQVTDIGDAMILKLLFTKIFENGCIIVATSNRHPDDLYKNGLQRSNFLPFIQVLKNHCDVIELNSGIDYRQKSAEVGGGGHGTYFITSQMAGGKNPVDILFKQLCANENDVVRPRTINILGRNVTFNKTCGNVLDSTFDELCNRPLGASDYIMLSNTFHTIIVREVPKITLSMRSEARRFIVLIDTLYDKKVRVVLSAAVPLKELFSSAKSDSMGDADRTLMDDLNINMGSENATASIFTGEEELFAFDRCLSRIFEMQTPDYWNKWDKFR